MTDPGPPEDKPPGLRQVISSVAASFFGVQSSKNRRRDFTHGKASHFIIVGAIATVLFILAVMIAVRIALRQAGT